MLFSHFTSKYLIQIIGRPSTLWIVVGLGYMALSPLALASEDSNEYKIKAAYIYNFTKFVTWPPDPSPTFNLCIEGNDPFAGVLDPIQKRNVSNRPIKVFRLPSDTPSPLLCHIIFSSTSRSLASPEATLTVGEQPSFAKNGGMIAFIERDGRIKLLVNLAAVKKSKLKMSAKLLEVSEILSEELP